ncbi:hypothetical protein IWQ56_005315, partial [Coemansia nantahalensis]
LQGALLAAGAAHSAMARPPAADMAAALISQLRASAKLGGEPAGFGGTIGVDDSNDEDGVSDASRSGLDDDIDDLADPESFVVSSAARPEAVSAGTPALSFPDVQSAFAAASSGPGRPSQPQLPSQPPQQQQQQHRHSQRRRSSHMSTHSYGGRLGQLPAHNESDDDEHSNMFFVDPNTMASSACFDDGGFTRFLRLHVEQQQQQQIAAPALTASPLPLPLPPASAVTRTVPAPTAVSGGLLLDVDLLAGASFGSPLL